MKKYKVLLMTFAAALSLGLGSCNGDLDTTPIDPNVKLPQDVLNSQDAFAQLLAKCYQGLACSASYGPDSSPDISGVDGGYGQYMRAIWNLQCLSSDEAICCWNDPTLPDVSQMTWTADNQFTRAGYYRVFFQVGLCNELIRQVNANPAGLTDEEFPAKGEFIAEARALRLLSYYHAIDLFGNVPFFTEKNSVGASAPAAIKRGDLFDWMVKEALDILDASELAEAGQNEYGRCDKGMVRMILAKLYLNAEVWSNEGTAMYAECAELCQQIIADYPLHTTASADNAEGVSAYAEMFRADNHLRWKNQTYGGDEIIFAVPQDGINTKSYGASNFLIFGAIGGDMDAASFGISSGWGGLSLLPEFTSLFEEGDTRAMFIDLYGQSVEDMFDYKKGGYKSTKFINVNHDGSAASAAGFVDTDMPLFRSADAYLMLAECVARGAAAGGSMSGLDAFNAIRERAFGNADHNVLELSEKIVLDERARELWWECSRRQDLIRYGLYTGSDYVWQWKGGVKEGVAVADTRNLMPLPPADVNANGNLTQNEGY